MHKYMQKTTELDSKLYWANERNKELEFDIKNIETFYKLCKLREEELQKKLKSYSEIENLVRTYERINKELEEENKYLKKLNKIYVKNNDENLKVLDF